MLEVEGLCKTFPLPRGRRSKGARPPGAHDPREQGQQFHAVRAVSFRAEAGRILGLLGPNGAGKTTLMRMMSTAIKPTAGTARFDGVDILQNPLGVRRTIGFLSGATGLYGRLTAREMIAYYGELHGLARAVVRARVQELARALAMEDYLDRRNDALSAGMKQKVSIARTLIHDPQVLIFDEPTTGLDVAAAQTVLELIARFKREGKTVIFSTHHMHEVERLCDDVVIIHQGELCFTGTIEDMRARTGARHLDQAFLALVNAGRGEGEVRA
ncbi:MAG: ATP-binding cassette domain-containing protein [Myxococcales bacterium]|nr:ATP-binding cassette domain-containing protein [Myxococcales bacterium]MCB9755031.1 ATP-binding cassette domain-containing protein [Myxococcales bacterium]